MNTVSYLLLSFSLGLVNIISTNTTPLGVTNHERGKNNRNTRLAQLDNSAQLIQDNLSSTNFRDSHSEINHEFENNLEDWQTQYELEQENQLREANPTFHKHKLKHKIISHFIPHGHLPTRHLFLSPVTPSVNQHWHHSHKTPILGHDDKKVQILNPSSGVENWDYGSFKPASHSQGIPQQNTNSFTNQNLHLNTHIINNQNTHLINQINHFGNGHRSNGFTNGLSREEPHNFVIINPHSNDPSENIRSTIYDSEMDTILNILDERSYHQVWPTKNPYSLYEENHLEEPENYDELVREPQECNHIWYVPEVIEKVSYDGRKSSRMNKNSEESDIKLQSPNIIQIPYNINYQSYGWGRRRNERSSEDDNSTIILNEMISPNRTIEDFNHNFKIEKIASNSSRNFSSQDFSNKPLPTKTLNHLENMNDTFEEYRNMINNYRNEIKQKEELIFADFLDGFVDDYQNKQFINSNDIKKIKKRSASIVKLLNDPNVKLDVPKTLENIGTITRNAFEDERAPMYHVRNLMGSTKNAVLSAMRIPPQNFIIPSNYQIENINPEEITPNSGEVLGAINQKMLSRSNFGKDGTKENYEQNNIEPSDPFGIVDTFNRMGTAIRDSVRSGQNTLSHIGDIAHNARKIYYSTKNTVPRVFIPYAKAPVLMKSRFKDDSKLPVMKQAVIITPKIVAIKEPVLGSDQPEPNYVKMGNILDAIGISKPDKDKLDLERFVIKTPETGNVRGIYIPPIGDVKSVNGKEIPDLLNAKKTLSDHNYEKVSSSKNVKDVLVKIKKDIENTLGKTKSRVKQATNNISNALHYHKKTNAEVENMLLKNKFKSYGDLESRVGSILRAKGGRVKNFTKEEEEKIIDMFLDNIFKMDKKHDVKSKSILYIEKKKQDKEHSKHFNKSLKDNSGSQIKMKPPSSSYGRSEDEVNELMKNLTLGIPIDEIENSESTKINLNNIRKNKIHKSTVLDKGKIYHKVKPELVLASRFADDNDMENQQLTRYPEELSENDEDIKQVDEYVVNHIVSSKNYDNLEQLKDDPSVEISEQFIQPHAENVTPHSPRTLLWLPKDSLNNQLPETNNIFELSKSKSTQKNKRSLNDQVVGLNLPPELLKPFMARASDGDVEKIFDSDRTSEVLGSVQSEYSGKRPYIIDKDKPVNIEDSTFSGVPLSYLMNEMRSRAIASGKNVVEYTKYNNPNLNSDDVNYETKQPLYTSFDQDDGTRSLENSRRNTDNSEHTLCSPFSPYRNSPILCGNPYLYSHYLEQNEVENKPYEVKSGVGQSRTSMALSDSLRKPFMGLENKDAVKKFYEEYNGVGFMDHSKDSVEHMLYSDY